jgi:hypothetical protein
MQRSNLIDHKSSLVLALILISMAACSQPPAAGTAAAPAAAAPAVINVTVREPEPVLV